MSGQSGVGSCPNSSNRCCSARLRFLLFPWILTGPPESARLTGLQNPRIPKWQRLPFVDGAKTAYEMPEVTLEAEARLDLRGA